MFKFAALKCDSEFLIYLSPLHSLLESDYTTYYKPVMHIIMLPFSPSYVTNKDYFRFKNYIMEKKSLISSTIKCLLPFSGMSTVAFARMVFMAAKNLKHKPSKVLSSFLLHIEFLSDVIGSNFSVKKGTSQTCTVYSGTPPYDHAVNTTTLLLQQLFCVPNESPVTSLFYNLVNPFTPKI